MEFSIKEENQNQQSGPVSAFIDPMIEEIPKQQSDPGSAQSQDCLTSKGNPNQQPGPGSPDQLGQDYRFEVEQEKLWSRPTAWSFPRWRAERGQETSW